MTTGPTTVTLPSSDYKKITFGFQFTGPVDGYTYAAAGKSRMTARNTAVRASYVEKYFEVSSSSPWTPTPVRRP